MYAQQNAIDPSLAALLQTAKMTTPDGGDTVAKKQVAAAMAQMQPQGIMQGMQGAKQDYAAAQPSMMRNMQQQQVQQMMQQAMQPKPAGIEQLPAQNMQGMQRMAGGGVVGYAGPDGSLVGGPTRIDVSGDVPIYAPRSDKDIGETEAEYRIRKAREAEEAQGEKPLPRAARWIEENILRPMSQMGGQRMSEMRGAQPQPQVVQPVERPRGQESYGPTPPVVAPDVAEAMRSGYAKFPGSELRGGTAVSSAAPRPPAPRPPAAQAAPQGGIAQLAARPTYDAASVAAAGAPYITASEGDIGKLREAEGKRAKFEKTLPDLSAKGIEALRQRMTDVEASEASRKERLGLDRVVQQLLGRAQGAGGAARADIQFMNAQRAAEDAFSQAKLGNQQAQLLMEKAQQERQLGRFDRAIALEKEAAALMEKARDNALKAQDLAQRGAGAQFQGAVQMRGQDITERTAAADRAAQAALRNLPTIEQKMADRVMNDWLAKNPGKTLADAWDFYRGAGKGLDQRSEATAEANRLKRQKLLADDQIYKLARFEFFQATDPAKKADAQRRMQEIERASGIADEAPVSTQPPPGVKVTRVGP